MARKGRFFATRLFFRVVAFAGLAYNSGDSTPRWRLIVAERPRILYVCSPNDSVESLPEALRSTTEVLTVHNPLRALARIAREKFDGIYVTADHLQNTVRLGRLIENDRILEGMPDAVALLDADL